MIQLQKYLPKEIIPQDELRAWREGLKNAEAFNCPLEVKQFISAVADLLPAFGQIGQFKTMISGYELKLAGMNEFNGEVIHNSFFYELPVPHLVAVDHHNAMHRIFNRKGRKGLVAYCKAHVKETNVANLLRILDEQVYHEHSEAYNAVMADIDGGT